MRMSPLHSALPILTVLTAFVAPGAAARQHDVPAARTTTVSIQADRLPHQRPAHPERRRLARAQGGRPAAELAHGAGRVRRPEPGDARAMGLRRHQSGTRRATRASSWRQWRSGGAMGCSRSRSTSRAAAPRATRRTSRGTTRRSPRTGRCGRNTWRARSQILDEPTGWGWWSSSASSTSGRTTPSRRGGRPPCRRRDRGLGARPGLPERAHRDQQRVQRQVRPRHPAACPRPRTHHAREGASRTDGRRLLVSTSYGGNTVPGDAVLGASTCPASRERRD